VTQLSPVDQLRAAAKILLQRADEAEADVDTNPAWRSALTDRPDWYANGVRNGLGGPAGELAALMHPGACRALAELLNHFARTAEWAHGMFGDSTGPDEFVSPYALDVAQAIIGGTP